MFGRIRAGQTQDVFLHSDATEKQQRAGSNRQQQQQRQRHQTFEYRRKQVFSKNNSF